ncbi:MAG: SHOCT domain-containing protein [Chitinophagaceae bacterium]|nr:SHOCT domain-containing protein [Chitinophagaceae bacterium]
MNFERAMEAFAGLPPELVIPENFKVRRTEVRVVETPVKETVKVVPIEKPASPEDLRKLLVADEIKKLFDLYKSGALTKEEYESQKKKLLSRQ